jgi:hypothetical protein
VSVCLCVCVSVCLCVCVSVCLCVYKSVTGVCLWAIGLQSRLQYELKEQDVACYEPTSKNKKPPYKSDDNSVQKFTFICNSLSLSLYIYIYIYMWTVREHICRNVEVYRSQHV